MQPRLIVATTLLSRVETDANNFISRIVAIKEVWARPYEPEMKRQATEWHTPNSPRPAKFWREQGKIKTLMIFPYDIRGIITSHRVETGQTVNGMYYKGYNQKLLRPEAS